MSPIAISIIAGCFTTGAYLPQLVMAIKTKKTEDLSLATFLVLLTGVSSWAIYGLLIENFALMCFNSVSAILIFAIIILKLKYK
ncbi:MAG: SemiSWEET family transporter [Alphaproteobacteria bacterium]|jgi:MtN3 and saliva related transmembrane protein|nr:SemiSWEET family transporter [Alphaproteobacteria bacterium]MCV6599691.1 SemiSWEET family transporter [Alphaproteobacteria bacterium]